MLRNGNKLFVMVFMLSMLFTVFNYLPIIEEESPTQRIELCKKLNQDTSGSDDCDQSDEDSYSEFVHASTGILSIYTITIQYLKHSLTSCFDFDRSQLKPPPKN